MFLLLGLLKFFYWVYEGPGIGAEHGPQFCKHDDESFTCSVELQAMVEVQELR